MNRIVVYLNESELVALRKQAEREIRDLREQARYLIRRGLLPTDSAPAQAESKPTEAGTKRQMGANE